MKNLLKLALLATSVSALAVTPTLARQGADDPAGHVRQCRGCDDPAGHVRQARGADDRVVEVRQARGADDPANHDANDDRGGRVRGADDRTPHD
jgi:hypothetical protein